MNPYRRVALILAICAATVLTVAASGHGASRAAAALPAADSPPRLASGSIGGIKLSQLVNVRRKGAKADDRTDDTAAFKAALAVAARRGTGIYVPAGVYRVSRLDLPNGVVVAGAGRTKAWIRGGVSFGSRTTIADLKIGDLGRSIQNRKGAARTTFLRCRLRGGGGSGTDAPVLMLGNASGHNSLRHVTFKNCLIERNLGVENWSNANGRGFNDITVNENAAAGGSHIAYLSFIGCHVGVSNGRGGHDTGSPRAGIEVWSSRSSTIAQGWHHLVIKRCTFEATDRFCIDLADFPTSSGRHLAGPALIEGNLIKGAGWGQGDHPWAYSICLEAPEGVTIRDNRIYAAQLTTVATSSGSHAGTIVEDNIIDLTVDNGVTQTRDEALVVKGGGNVVRRNVIQGGALTGTLLYLKDTTGSKVTANRLTDTKTGGNLPIVVLLDATGNAIAKNVFATRSTTSPQILTQGASSGNTFSGNRFLHR